jgi:hypothetical protein
MPEGSFINPMLSVNFGIGYEFASGIGFRFAGKYGGSLEETNSNGGCLDGTNDGKFGVFGIAVGVAFTYRF